VSDPPATSNGPIRFGVQLRTFRSPVIEGIDAWAAQLARTLDPFSELGASISAFTTQWSEAFDAPIKRLLRDLQESVPENVRGNGLLRPAGDLMLEEGLPLWGAPRREIVLELVELADGEARLQHLWQRRAEVLDDCEELLRDQHHAGAELSRKSIGALRDGHPEAAQCLATNLIDETVDEIFGGKERAKRFAQEDYMDKPIRMSSHYLAVRPIVLALTRWRPEYETPPPDRYSRHVTVHRPTSEGVFEPPRPLIAVMLAATLTAAFSDFLDPDTAVS